MKLLFTKLHPWMYNNTTSVGVVFYYERLSRQDMLIYHGSDHIIEKPIYHGGKSNNDYGYGFYCTEHPDMAREWSVSDNRAGYVNQYETDESGLTILYLDEYPILTWLTILLENRVFRLDSPLAREASAYLKKEFRIPYESYDIINGYRADDSYFSFAQDFINGTISLTQLNKAMKLGKLGKQVVLMSRRAFSATTFAGVEEVDPLVWYPKRKKRDEKARADYFSMDRMGYVRGDIYITRILDEEMKRDDARLQ